VLEAVIVVALTEPPERLVAVAALPLIEMPHVPTAPVPLYVGA